MSSSSYSSSSSSSSIPQVYIIPSLENFYRKENNWQKFLSLNQNKRKNGISKTTLNWLVTNYVKEYPESCAWKLEDGTVFTLVHSYQHHLHSVGKQKLDPFCRGEKFLFNGVLTTKGQLQFIKWAIENKVLDFAIENKDRIESHKRTVNKNREVEKNAEKEMIRSNKIKICSMASIKRKRKTERARRKELITGKKLFQMLYKETTVNI